MTTDSERVHGLRHRSFVPRLPAGSLLADAVRASQRAGSSAVPGGPPDEPSHLLTMLLVPWAPGDRLSVPIAAPALIASLAIDIDQIPARLGGDWLTRGTPRPNPRSLLTIAVLVLAALLSRRRRALCLGLAIGVAVHRWRDLTEDGSGVASLWPLSDRSFSAPQPAYTTTVAITVCLCGRVASHRRRHVTR